MTNWPDICPKLFIDEYWETKDLLKNFEPDTDKENNVESFSQETGKTR